MRFLLQPLGEITDDDAHDAEIRVAERGVFKADVPQHRQEHGGQKADEQPVDKGSQNGAATAAGGVSEHPGRRPGKEMENQTGDDQRGADPRQDRQPHQTAGKAGDETDDDGGGA